MENIFRIKKKVPIIKLVQKKVWTCYNVEKQHCHFSESRISFQRVYIYCKLGCEFHLIVAYMLAQFLCVSRQVGCASLYQRLIVKHFLFYQRKLTLHFCNMMSSLTAVAAEVTAHKRSLVWCNVYMREGKLCFSNANAEVYLADK